MKWILLGILFSLTACHATTAYNADHTKSWTCIQNPEPVQKPMDDYSFLQGKSVPIGPLLVTEPPKKEVEAVAKK